MGYLTENSIDWKDVLTRRYLSEDFIRKHKIDKQMNEIDKEEKEDREIKKELVEINKRINKIIEACN